MEQDEKSMYGSRLWLIDSESVPFELLAISAELRSLKQREKTLLERRLAIQAVAAHTEDKFSWIANKVDSLEQTLSSSTEKFDLVDRGILLLPLSVSLPSKDVAHILQPTVLPPNGTAVSTLIPVFLSSLLCLRGRVSLGPYEKAPTLCRGIRICPAHQGQVATFSKIRKAYRSVGTSEGRSLNIQQMESRSIPGYVYFIMNYANDDGYYKNGLCPFYKKEPRNYKIDSSLANKRQLNKKKRKELKKKGMQLKITQDSNGTDCRITKFSVIPLLPQKINSNVQNEQNPTFNVFAKIETINVKENLNQIRSKIENM
ncbi:hypothetical protein M5K25_013492 [Dendrobium thyrsiflorum]|uniref:Uncharacterized protein n=1 Tax=Dendrobium thyrsiflorum TaxID=117978 RepID=A0ABD0UU11_DENTH